MALNLTLWAINGVTFADLGIEEPKLRVGNMVADVFSFADPTAAFDADLLYATDAEIVLNRGEVVVFRGRVDTVPRFLGAQAESISYTAIGPWGWLGEYPFLQSYKYVAHPEMPNADLFSQSHSRVVLGQGDNGAKLSIKDVVTQILNCAIANGCPIAIGTIVGFDQAGIWDEATDLYCDEAIRRALNAAPDAVVTWGYAVNPPTFNLSRRDTLAEVTLKVRPPLAGAPPEGPADAYAPFESISITPLPKQVVDTVVVFYRSTDSVGFGMSEILDYEVAGTSALVLAIAPRAAARLAARTPAIEAENAAVAALIAVGRDPDGDGLAAAVTSTRAAATIAWAAYTAATRAEAAAVNAAAGSRGALVRTIDLAGARVTVDNATQPVTVKPFYARLVFETPDRAAPNDLLKAGDTDFLRVEAFWKRQVDWLGQPGVNVVGFRYPTRRSVDSEEDGDFDPTCENELTLGGIAQWMRDKRGIVDEEQMFGVRVLADIPVPDAPGTFTRRVADVTARVTATNAQTRVYSYNTSWSLEAAEARPADMAGQLLRPHQLLHYDGTLTLVEEEVSLAITPANALNLDCAARPEWATIRAQAQLLDIDIATGHTAITLGPPKQLHPGDTIETFGVNRTRREISGSNARSTGLTFQ